MRTTSGASASTVPPADVPPTDLPPTRLLVAWAAAGSARSEADAVLRLVVARFCATDPADVEVGRLCPRCGSDAHGRPYVGGHADLHVSLSRADGLVCVAVTDAGQVGVDVERAGAAAFAGFADVGLHPLELPIGPSEQTITWVRKESLVKATGDGLAVDLRGIRLTGPAAPPRLLSWEASGPPQGPVWMLDVDGPPGYVLAVTVLAAHAPQVSVLEAGQARAVPRATR